jgi:hypothetical protein
MSEPTKKRPGRPPENKNKKDPSKRVGIVVDPHVKDNRLELKYSEPIIFKVLWSHLKMMEISNVQIIFRKDEVIIYGQDHSEHNHVYIRIDARKLDMYYCESEFDIGISHKITSAYINTIDKKDTRHIDIVSKKKDSTESITIAFSTMMDSYEIHKINVADEYEKLTKGLEAQFLDTNYKVSFTLPDKYFKKKMADFSLTKTETIDFVYNGKGSPFTIMYEDPNKCASSKIPFIGAEKINFKSQMKDGETFRITAPLDDLKSMSSIGFDNNVDIHLDENKPILVKTKLDDEGIFEMFILTRVCSKA